MPQDEAADEGHGPAEADGGGKPQTARETEATGQSSGEHAVGARMLAYARARLAEGAHVTGADLDIDRWVWELPGGYVEETEDATAVREVEEETGWRPAKLEPLIAFQPMVGTADAENLLFIGHGAEYVGTPADINEAKHVEWIGLATVPDRIGRGGIVGAASIIGLLAALGRRASTGPGRYH